MHSEEYSQLYKMRHSLSHVLAAAVKELHPDVQLGIGPPVDNGFYYDFVFAQPISADDLPTIEKKMKHKSVRNRAGCKHYDHTRREHYRPSATTSLVNRYPVFPAGIDKQVPVDFAGSPEDNLDLPLGIHFDKNLI